MSTGGFLREDWRPRLIDVERVLDRVRALGIDTTYIEAGLVALAGGPREPGIDDEPATHATDDEVEDLVPLSEILATASIKTEIAHGSRRTRLEALIHGGG